VTRIFKLSRYFTAGQEFVRLLQHACPSLMVMLFFVLGMLIVAGSALLYTEDFAGRITDPGTTPGPNYDKTFSSIPGAMFFTLTTMAQVGYGDAVPTTIIGRLIALLVAFSGFVLFALAVTVVSQHYHHMKRVDAMVEEMEEKEKAVRQVKRRFGIRRAISANYADGAKASATRDLAQYLRQMGIDTASDIESDLDEMESDNDGRDDSVSESGELGGVRDPQHDYNTAATASAMGTHGVNSDDKQGGIGHVLVGPQGVVNKEAERARRDEERVALDRYPFAQTTGKALNRFARSNDGVDFVETRIKSDFRGFQGDTAEWWDYDID